MKHVKGLALLRDSIPGVSGRNRGGSVAQCPGGGMLRRTRGEDGFAHILQSAASKVETQHYAIGTEIPHTGDKHSGWNDEQPSSWISGFYTGLLIQAGRVTGNLRVDSVFQRRRLINEAILRQPATQNHDLGFQFLTTCVAVYQLAGCPDAREMALRAADILRSLFRYNGEVIQAWTPCPAYKPKRRSSVVGKAIIDTMMNVSLLYWAAHVRRDESYADVATMHARTTRKYLVREDGSTFHHYKFDPYTGDPLGGMTGQGYANDSCWSRGQAWAILGFANAYQHTGEPEFLSTAVSTARFVERRLPGTLLCPWDFDAPDRSRIDSSACAATICGLYKLADLMPGHEGREWKEMAGRMLCALIDQCDLAREERMYGLLDDGASHVPAGRPNGLLIYGDYFYLEALMRANGYRDFPWC